MKYLIILAVAFSLNLKAQTLNSIDKDIITINNTIMFNSSTSELITIFDNPSSTSSELWETSEENVEVYHYLNTNFQFVNNQLKSFKLCSSNYELRLGSTLIKVGNNIDDLQTVLNDSYNNKSNEYMAININLGDSEFITIQFNPSNHIILSIEHRFY